MMSLLGYISGAPIMNDDLQPELRFNLSFPIWICLLVKARLTALPGLGQWILSAKVSLKQPLAVYLPGGPSN
jgi:hypothetical protein